MGYKTRSTGIILGMSAMVFIFFYIVGTFFMEWSIYIIAAFSLGGIFLQYLLGPIFLQWIYRIDWLTINEVNDKLPYIANLIGDVCRKYNIKDPKFGIIPDGNPNAFTFGWTKNSARIVITEGILNILEPEEQKTVVAHELGHVVHQDFIVMTFISAIPILFYTLFRVLTNSFIFGRYGGTRSSRSSGKSRQSIQFIKIGLAILSWIFYIIGTFLSLLLSRYREYMADEFAAMETQNPNALATGLVKIAYGILQKPEEKQKGRIRSNSEYVRALGIFNKKSAKELAYSATSPEGKINNNIIAKAAAWDLFHPWAKYFELFSTHPLPAKRIKELSYIGFKEFGQKPSVDLSPAKQEFKKQMGKTAIDEFIGELIIQVLPRFMFFTWIILTLGLLFGDFEFSSIPFINFNNFASFMAVGLIISGIFQLIRVSFKYKGNFKPHSVIDLIGTINVSPIRPVPTITRGKVIGRGVPGVFWSEDVVILGENGIMHIDYDYGIGFINTLFGIFKIKKLKGQMVEVTGWYRRGPSPFIQVHRIQLLTGSQDRFGNHKKGLAKIGAFITIALGLVLYYYLNMVIFTF